MNRLRKVFYLNLTILTLSLGSCSKPKVEEEVVTTPSTPQTTTQYLYVASGNCYSGTVPNGGSGINTITKFSLTTGLPVGQPILDYSGYSPGDSPASIFNYNDSELLILTDQITATASRRVEAVKKDGSGNIRQIFTNANLAGAGVISRALHYLPGSGDFFISKQFAIERFNSAKQRVTSGTNPYVLASGLTGSCANSATNITKMITLDSVSPNSSGHILYAHAGGATNNRIVAVDYLGSNSVTPCRAAQASPQVTAIPVSLDLVPGTGKILVVYANPATTSDLNSIYQYSVTQTASSVTFGTATKLYENASALYGASASTFDPQTNSFFVASAPYNTIERFSYSSTDNTLTRVTGANSTPFISANVYTRCVTSMFVGK